WTPTAEQSAQNYQVRVKVYDDNVEKIVAFEVHVAADKYLHTEVQDGKLVVVDPNSKLDGLMVEPLDGSDPGLMKIKIALDSQLPQKDLDATYKIRLADAFMIENKPKEYVIHIKNMQSFLDRFGASKMALRYYLIEGEDEHFGGTSWEISEIKNSKTEVFRQYLERTKRPYFYFFTIPKYLSLLEEDSIVTKKSLALDTQMPVMEKSSTTLCQVHRVPTEWDDYPDTYEFICPLNANTTLTIVDEQALSPDYTIWDGVTRYCTSMATRGTTQCIIIGYGYS
ncbi:MAG: hypothetical protein KAH32_09170, partial [Chlamydiia bacterium]|nr:hypothetical protein [Chlamydiia bacterium]